MSLFGVLLLAVISRYTLVQLTQCGHLASSLSRLRGGETNSNPTYPQVGFEAFGIVRKQNRLPPTSFDEKHRLDRLSASLESRP